MPASASTTCCERPEVTSTVVAVPSPSPSTANTQVVCGVAVTAAHRSRWMRMPLALSHDSDDNRVTSRSTERAMADSTHPAKGPGRPYSSMPVVPS